MKIVKRHHGAGVILCWLLGWVVPIHGQAEFKVFISVDMEGIAGVAASDECSRSGLDYGLFRRLMTLEASAAVEAALEAGATEVWVRDSHGSARNILPDLLHERAVLVRDWSGGPKSMMEGIDDSFAAAVFIGYHARAGTPDAIIDHTMSGVVTDLQVNGRSLPEAGWNALIAGRYRVPVVFVSGDKALCRQAEELFGEVETVAVKDAIGAAAVCLHPSVARSRIQTGVRRALQQLDRYQPFTLSPPYTMVLKLKDETRIYDGSFYPGAVRSGDWELTYRSDDIMEVVKAFEWMLK
jgi:D-amino peptidase